MCDTDLIDAYDLAENGRGGAEIRARLNIGSKIYIGSKYRLGMVAPGVQITLSKKKELI